MVRAILMTVFCIFTTIMAFAQDTEKSCSSVKYEDNNYLNPPIIVLKKIKGTVFSISKNKNELPLPDVCIGVFDEDTKKLIKVITPNENGQFNFKKIPEGNYRLVVVHFYKAYCAANMRVQVNKKSKEKKKIVVRMIISETDDSCSYGRLS